jgi:hypothetical protein
MTRREQQVVDTRNHVLSVFDGAVMAGSLVERAGEFHAYDVDGKYLGAFGDMRQARALPHITESTDTLIGRRTRNRNSLSGGRRHGC